MQHTRFRCGTPGYGSPRSGVCLITNPAKIFSENKESADQVCIFFVLRIKSGGKRGSALYSLAVCTSLRSGLAYHGRRFENILKPPQLIPRIDRSKKIEKQLFPFSWFSITGESTEIVDFGKSTLRGKTRHSNPPSSTADLSGAH